MARRRKKHEKTIRRERRMAYLRSQAINPEELNLQNVSSADPSTASSTSCSPRFQIQGSLHQGSQFFSDDSAGRQCTAMAYVAILYSYVHGIESLCASDVDSILCLGDDMYRAVPHQNDYLEYIELPQAVSLHPLNTFVKASFGPLFYGVLNQTYDTGEHLVSHCLQSALTKVMNNQSYLGCLLVAAGFTISVFRHGQVYILFDSHSRNLEGHITDDGAAVMLSFRSIQNIVVHVCSLYSNNLSAEFNVVPVTIPFVTPLHQTVQSGVCTSQTDDLMQTYFLDQEKKRKQSNEMAHKTNCCMSSLEVNRQRGAKTTYKCNTSYRQRKLATQKEKYHCNIEWSQNHRETMKHSLKTRYAEDAEYKNQKKQSFKTRYSQNAKYKERKKQSLKTRYSQDAEYKEKKKQSYKTRYSQHAEYKEKKKQSWKVKYGQNAEYKKKKNTSDAERYRCDLPHQVKKKLTQKRKYQDDVSYRKRKSTKRRKSNVQRQPLDVAIKRFLSAVRSGPEYVCTSCHRLLFSNQVIECNRNVYSVTPEKEVNASMCLTGDFIHDSCRCPIESDSTTEEVSSKICKKCMKEWICHACHNSLKNGKVPSLSVVNGLQLDSIPHEMQDLNFLERQLLALHLPFAKMFSLPRGGQKGVTGPVICVPSNVSQTIESLPRQMNESALIQVKLKRKLEYRGYVSYQLIRPNKLKTALQFLVTNNELYKEVHVNNSWEEDNHASNEDIISVTQQQCDINDTRHNSGEQSQNLGLNDCINDQEVHSLVDPYQSTSAASPRHIQENVIVTSDMQTEHGPTSLQTNAPSMHDSPVGSVDDKEVSNQTQNNYMMPLDTCLQPVDIAQEVLDQQTVYCVAPAQGNRPISILNVKDVEALSFPQQFPYGRNHYNTERLVKIGLNPYFNARLFNVDSRFSSDNSYIFFAQYISELSQILSSISIAMRKGSARTHSGQKITARMLTDKDAVREILKSDKGFRFLQPIRGTPPYWERTLKDLFAMIKQIGIPTWFATFSAADLRWPEVLHALLMCSSDPKRNIEDLSFQEKSKLLQENPVLAARMFDHRVHVLFHELLLSKAEPLGKIVDFFWRTEFQVRGSPHIHCLLWVENAPKLDEDSDELVCAFIDKYISTELPDPEVDPVLHQIIKQVQTHSKNHSKTCFKGSGSRQSQICRFLFPRPPMLQTTIFRPSKSKEPDMPTTETADTDTAHGPCPPSQLDEIPQNPEQDDFDSVKGQITKKQAKANLQKVRHLLEEIVSDTSEVPTTQQLLAKADLTMEEFMQSMSFLSKKISIQLKREPKDAWVNNYNPELLKAWNGNMDLQYITDAWACIMYILSYISKAEHEMSALLKQALEDARTGDCNVVKEMRHIGNVYLQNREVSAQEAVYRVTGMKLKDCSRQVIYVPTDPNPTKMSLPLKTIQAKTKTDSDDIWMTSIVDRYKARPDQPPFPDMCLAYFVSNYRVLTSLNSKQSERAEQNTDDQAPDNEGETTESSPIIQLQNGKGYIQKRSRGSPAIVKTARYPRLKFPEKYIHNLLALYLPFRTDEQLGPGPYETFENFYEQAAVKLAGADMPERVLTIVERNRQQFELAAASIDLAMDQMQENPVLEDAWAQIAPSTENERRETNTESEDLAQDEGLENDRIQELSDAAHSAGMLGSAGIETTTSQETAEQIKGILQSLNEKQTTVFNSVRQWCLLKKQGANPEPLRIFVSGSAGVGKSHVIRAICYEAKKLLQSVADNPGNCTVLLTASTGPAAFNIDGQTLNSALSIPNEREIPIKPLGETTLNTLRAALYNIQVLVIDEISMIDWKMLNYVDSRLKQITGNKQQIFGGVTVLAFGDFYQLPPVRAYRLVTMNAQDPRNIWTSEFQLMELTEIMRQRDEAHFAHLLNRIRTRERSTPLDEADETLLKSRVIECTPSDSDYPSEALHVYSTKREVSAYNLTKLYQLPDAIIVTLQADDSRHDKLTGNETGTTTTQTAKKDDIPKSIDIAVNAKVMLLRNIDVTDGLVNGAIGHVTSILPSRNTAKLPTAIAVKFDDQKVGKKTMNNSKYKSSIPAGSVAIEPIQVKLDGTNITRTQYPLSLAWASTIHKTQGKTLKHIVVSLKTIFTAGQAYVALSRVTSISGLHLLDYHPSKIYCFPAVKEGLAQMTPLPDSSSHPLRVSPTDLHFLKIIHHNIEGLLPHFNDLQHNHDIPYSDVLCLSETWLHARPSDSVQLHNFTLYYNNRSTSYAEDSPFYQMQRGGVAVYVKQNLDSQQINLGVTNLEYLAVEIKQGQMCTLVIAIYRPPSYPSPSFCQVLQQTLQAAASVCDTTDQIIVTGDFNEDLNQRNTPVKDLFTTHGYSQLISHATTTEGTRIDHMYVNSTLPIDSTAIESGVLSTYYSYHDPIYGIIPLSSL